MLKTRHILAISFTAIIAASASAFAVSAAMSNYVQLNQDKAWTDKAMSYQQTEDALVPATFADNQNSILQDSVHIQALMPVKRDHIKAAEFIKSEQICLARAVYYEARSERRSGQMAVAEVVLNRVKSKHYPSSICGVVYQGSGRKSGCQFSFTCDGSYNEPPKGKAWDEAKKIATFMQTHDFTPLTNGATHYHTVAIDPKWSSNLRFDRQIGSHKFYRFKFTERPVVSVPAIAIAPPI